MNHLCVLILSVILAGCALDKAIVPTCEGKPRVKINSPHAPSQPSTSSIN